MKLHIQLQPEGAESAAQQFEIPFAEDTVVIGRGPDSPVPLEGSKLSRNHVAFGVLNGRLTLTDLSSNGVWVNAQSVPKKSAVPINGSEEISIPGYRLRARLLLPPPEPAPRPAAPPPAVSSVAVSSVAVSSPAAPAPEKPAAAANALTQENRRVTAELISESLSATLEEPTPAGPPWWKLSSSERLILLFVALSIGLFAYYYSLQ